MWLEGPVRKWVGQMTLTVEVETWEERSLQQSGEVPGESGDNYISFAYHFSQMRSWVKQTLTHTHTHTHTY